MGQILGHTGNYFASAASLKRAALLVALLSVSVVASAETITFSNLDVLISGGAGVGGGLGPGNAMGQTIQVTQRTVLDSISLYAIVSGSPPRPDLPYDFFIAEFDGERPTNLLFSQTGNLLLDAKSGFTPETFLPNITLTENLSYIAYISTENYDRDDIPALSRISVFVVRGSDPETYPLGTIYFAGGPQFLSGEPWDCGDVGDGCGTGDMIFEYTGTIVPVPAALPLLASALLGIGAFRISRRTI